ncbi:unnamed protein product [Rotaria magnacalcarata]|uniref:UBZ1-type domain-containing protein n=1 Tax=Rotaria magnacalcarata TaxID=392030 RepID=A0A818W969_9BILA|nr:unnamed protein product [Rotaria magnacalcarata]CAF3722492.1 unnamed protein product [Rotaria magnacalcarata]
MSNIFDEPNRHSYRSSKEENEIREIFYNHWEELKKHADEAIGTINSWRSEHIRKIGMYAETQIRILIMHYDNQRSIFNQERENYLSRAKAYHDSKKKDVFNDMRDRCRLLKFQVAELKYILDEQQQQPRPQVTPVENYSQRNKLQANMMPTLEFENRQRGPTDENIQMRKRDENNTSSTFTNSIPSMPNGIREEQLATSSSSVYGTTINGNNMLVTTTTKDDDDANNKCPICFMIFSANMTRQSQYEHVDQHIVDNNNTESVNF